MRKYYKIENIIYVFEDMGNNDYEMLEFKDMTTNYFFKYDKVTHTTIKNINNLQIFITYNEYTKPVINKLVYTYFAS